jgi:hypothetical protein
MPNASSRAGPARPPAFMPRHFPTRVSMIAHRVHRATVPPARRATCRWYSSPSWVFP